MKKIARLGLFFVILTLFCVLLVSCGQQQSDSVKSVILHTSEIVLELGKTHQMQVTIDGSATNEIVWKSDAPEIVSVSNSGEVVANALGTAVVSVTLGNKSDYCQIIVVEKGSTVVDDETKADGYLYYEDFDNKTQLPSHLRTLVTGGGAIGVSDGVLDMSVTGTGSAYVSYIFDEPLSGKVVIETRVQVTTTSFSNVIYLYRGEDGYNTNDAVVTLGMDGGGFKNHNGQGWSSPIARYNVNQWYDIKMEIEIGKSTYNLYIDGVQMAKQSFRKTGDGIEDSIKLLQLGLGKMNSGIKYDYVKIYQDKTPAIESSKTTYSFVTGEKEELHLNYQITGTPRPTVTVEHQYGDLIAVGEDNKTLSFKQSPTPGEYTVTVRAENEHGVAEKTFTILVVANSNELFNAEFTSGNGGLTLNGDAAVENGYLVLKTPESGGTVTALYDFTQPLTGKIYAETKIINKQSDTFANVLFTYQKGTTTFTASACTTSLAIENGTLKYHNGSGWKSIVAIPENTEVVIGVLYDFENGTMSVYVNDDLVLENGSMRNSSMDTSVLIIGSGKANTHILYDYIKIVKMSNEE